MLLALVFTYHCMYGIASRNNDDIMSETKTQTLIPSIRLTRTRTRTRSRQDLIDMEMGKIEQE